MFGFSLPKLLFTALLIGVVWYGFKYLSREHRKNDPAVDDTVRCGTCGDFVVEEGAQNCGKPGCPYATP